MKQLQVYKNQKDQNSIFELKLRCLSNSTYTTLIGNIWVSLSLLKSLAWLILKSSFLICSVVDERGYSPLHSACEVGSPEITYFLCREGADLYVETPTGYQPIQIAASVGHLDCVKILNDNGVDKETLTVDGSTLVQLAARQLVLDKKFYCEFVHLSIFKYSFMHLIVCKICVHKYLKCEKYSYFFRFLELHIVCLMQCFS